MPILRGINAFAWSEYVPTYGTTRRLPRSRSILAPARLVAVLLVGLVARATAAPSHTLVSNIGDPAEITLIRDQWTDGITFTTSPLTDVKMIFDISVAPDSAVQATIGDEDHDPDGTLFFYNSANGQGLNQVARTIYPTGIGVLKIMVVTSFGSDQGLFEEGFQPTTMYFTCNVKEKMSTNLEGLFMVKGYLSFSNITITKGSDLDVGFSISLDAGVGTLYKSDQCNDDRNSCTEIVSGSANSLISPSGSLDSRFMFYPNSSGIASFRLIPTSGLDQNSFASSGYVFNTSILETIDFTHTAQRSTILVNQRSRNIYVRINFPQSGASSIFSIETSVGSALLSKQFLVFDPQTDYFTITAVSAGELTFRLRPADSTTQVARAMSDRDGSGAYYDFKAIATDPIYFPPVGFASQVTPISWTGVVDGGWVSMSSSASCAGAADMPSSAYSLSRQQITNNQIQTSTVMTATTPLYICLAVEQISGACSFATECAICQTDVNCATAGEDCSADCYVQTLIDTSVYDQYDFMLLTEIVNLLSTPNSFSQRTMPTYHPQRSVESSSQRISFTDTIAGDQTAFNLAQSSGLSCSNYSDYTQAAGSSSTSAVYNISDINPNIQLHDYAANGFWTLCYKPDGGVWTSFTANLDLNIISKPSYSPEQGLAGLSQQIDFSEGDPLHPISDGDFVVIKQGNCSVAHNSVLSSSSMLPTALNSLSMHTAVEMTDAQLMSVCYATVESGGATDGDYGTLDAGFRQLAFTPTRTVFGAVQVMTVKGGKAGDTVVWAADCSGAATAWPGSTMTAEYAIGSDDVTFTLHALSMLNVGMYDICYKAVGTTYIKVEGVALQVIAVPLYSPAIGLAGSASAVTFSGTVDGDVVVMRVSDCSSAPGTVTASDSLAPSTISSATISTSEQMTALGDLVLCFATAEAVAAGGNSADDYVELSGVYTQVDTPKFDVTRSITGAETVMTIIDTISNDLLAWSFYGCAVDMSSALSWARTAVYTVSSAPHQFQLHDNMTVGNWSFCVNPQGAGVWTEAAGRPLTVISRPIFSPVIALASTPTAITLSEPAIPGDFVVLQIGSCAGAHSAVLSNQAIPKQALNSGLVVYTHNVTDLATPLTVCVATIESGGDDEGDYSTMDGLLYQVKFSPTRVFQGTAQKLQVEGGKAGDQVGWTLYDCNTFDVSTAATTSRTATYTLTGPNDQFDLHTGVLVGEWGLCLKLAEGSNFHETGWDGYKLRILQTPQFTPSVGISETVNQIFFTGAAADGDFVVLQPNDCVDAHRSSDESGTRMPPAVLSGLEVNTPANMVNAMTYKVCMATSESGGEDATDYVSLTVTGVFGGIYVMQAPVTFTPTRTVQKAAQDLIVSGGYNGDQLVWILYPLECTTDSTFGNGNPNKTFVYTVGGATQTLTFGVDANAGSWRMCYLPAGGLWTYVQNRAITVVATPDITPDVGIAGSVTPITFYGDVIDGDFLVLQETNCINAHLAVQGVSSLPPTLISGMTAHTATYMTLYGVTVKACYATKESGGETDDDYVDLPTDIRQVREAQYQPHRMVDGTAQRVNVYEVAFANYMYKFVLWPDCLTPVSSMPATRTTPEYMADQGNLNYFSMDPNYEEGLWKFCYKPDGGVWTRLHNQDLTMMPKPTFFPLRGLTGLTVNMTIFGHPAGVVGGDGYTDAEVLMEDRIVIQEGNCDNAHLVTTTSNSLGSIALNNRSQFPTGTVLSSLTGTGEGGLGGSNLKLCFTTYEASRACPDAAAFGAECHDKDDYAELELPYQLVRLPDFKVGSAVSDKRTVTGALQRIDVLDGYVNDTAAWTLDPNCWYLDDKGHDRDRLSQVPGYPDEWTQVALQNQTVHYHPILDDNHEIKLHDFAFPGTWQYCYRPRDGIFTLVPLPKIIMEPKPTFFPVVGFTGVATTITFAGLAINNQVVYDLGTVGSSGPTFGAVGGFPTTIGEFNPDQIYSKPTRTPVIYGESAVDLDLGVLQYSTRCELAYASTFTPTSTSRTELIDLNVNTTEQMSTTIPWRTTPMNGTNAPLYPAWVGGTLVPDNQMQGGSAVSVVIRPLVSTRLRVCFATQESGGDTIGDYTELDNPFRQLDFTPIRSIQGAGQNLRVTGVVDGDTIVWTQDVHCDDAGSNASSTKTDEYLIRGENDTFTLRDRFDEYVLDHGTYHVCYKPKYGNYTRVVGRNLTIVDRPSFASYDGSHFGFSLDAFSVTFSGDALVNQPGVRTGDWVVMQMDNCSNAHEKTTHSYQMGRDQLDAMMAIYTKVEMDRAAVLQVCYASYESFGDEPGDYTHLRMNWTQVRATFSPSRTTFNAAQKVLVVGATPGDRVMWSTGACPGTNTPTGAATASKTVEYEFQSIDTGLDYGLGNEFSPADSYLTQPTAAELHSVKSDHSQSAQYTSYSDHDFPVDNWFTLHTEAAPGIWATCYFRSAVQKWYRHSMLYNISIQPQPTFGPLVGIAGSFTKITMTNNGGVVADYPHQLKRLTGDYVAIQAGDCANASLVVNTAVSQGFTEIVVDPYNPSEDVVFVHPGLSTVGIYKLCFATKEAVDAGSAERYEATSISNTHDDYIELWAGNLSQIYPPEFHPKRSVLGAERTIAFYGESFQVGDGVALTQYANCSALQGYTNVAPGTITAAAYSGIQTIEHSVTSVPYHLELHPTITNGTYSICHLPFRTLSSGRSVGLWTEIYHTAFVLVTPPTFFPPVGIAGTVTTVEFFGAFPRHTSEGQSLGTPALLTPKIDLNGDVIVFQHNDCSNAHLTVTSSTSLQQTPMATLSNSFGVYTHSLVYTKTAMINVTDLVICYATREANGSMAEDFVKLTGLHNSADVVLSEPSTFFTQRIPPDFTPKRTGVGHEQIIDMMDTEAGDMVAWRHYSDQKVLDLEAVAQYGPDVVAVDSRWPTPSRLVQGVDITEYGGNETGRTDGCDMIQGGALLNKTAEYTLSSPWRVTLTDTLVNGTYIMCFRPFGGVYTQVIKRTLPHHQSCHQMEEMADVFGSYDMCRQRLYIVPKPVFAPRILVAGSVTPITVYGYMNSFVYYRQQRDTHPYALYEPIPIKPSAINTTNLNYNLPQPVHPCLLTRTGPDMPPLVAAQGNSGVECPAEMDPGTPTMWGHHLQKGVLETDFIVISPSGYDCVGASTRSANSNFMQKQTINGSRIYTPEHLSFSRALLEVCYATRESLGDSDDDFVRISSDPAEDPSMSKSLYNQIPITFSPQRLPIGASRALTINSMSNRQVYHYVSPTDGSIPAWLSSAGIEMIAWTQAPTCLNIPDYAGAGVNATAECAGCGLGSDHENSPRSYRTQTYASSSGPDFSLWANITNGTYYVCYKPAGGMWTRMSERTNMHTYATRPARTIQTLVLVPKPTFWPQVGIAGSITDLMFYGDWKVGDRIVIKAGSCDNAHNIPHGGTSKRSTDMATTTLKDGRVVAGSTTVHMTTWTHLVVCYSTHEASGSVEQSANYAPLDFDSLTVHDPNHVTYFKQRQPSIFDPDRTITGALQLLKVTGGSEGDLYQWNMESAADCFNTAGAFSAPDILANSTREKTIEYYFPHTTPCPLQQVGCNAWGGHLQFELHALAKYADHWVFCHKPIEGVWTLIENEKLTVIPKPSFSPLVGVAGSITSISFETDGSGAQYFANPLWSDVIVMQPNDCTNAHLTQTTGTSMGQQTLNGNDAESRTWVDSILTHVAMDGSAVLKVCYATRESGADSADDFISLDLDGTTDQPAFVADFTQVLPMTFEPIRTIYSAPQLLFSEAGQEGDLLGWTQEPTCDSFYKHTDFQNTTILNAWNLNTSDPHYIGPMVEPLLRELGSLYPIDFNINTKVYTTASAAAQDNLLHTSASVGEYHLCIRLGAHYDPQRSVGGLWTRITDSNLTIFGKPDFTPKVGAAGSVTPITILPLNTYAASMERHAGDFVVLQEGTGALGGSYGSCRNAHIQNTSAISLTQTALHDFDAATAPQYTAALSVAGDILFYTNISMLNASVLTLCYASAESLGDSNDDYVPIGTIDHLALDWDPQRSVAGARQEITLTGGQSGDQLIWTMNSDCSTFTGGPQSLYTAVYSVTTNGYATNYWTDRPRDMGLAWSIDRTFKGSVSKPWGTSHTTVFTLHTFASVGLYSACYLPNGGVMTRILRNSLDETMVLDLVQRPTFYPSLGMAGSVTGVAVTGQVNLDGDFMVIQQSGCQPYTPNGTNFTTLIHPQGIHLCHCTGAAAHVDGDLYNNPSPSAVGKQLINGRPWVDYTQAGAHGINTAFSLTDASHYTTPPVFGGLRATTYQMCFASKESGGDSDDDYVTLEMNFTQVQPPTFRPNTTMVASLETMHVSSWREGDLVVWTMLDNCSTLEVVEQKGRGKSAVFYLEETYNESTCEYPTGYVEEVGCGTGFRLHKTTTAGDWRMCYRPAGSEYWGGDGLWTEITGQVLNLLPIPDLSAPTWFKFMYLPPKLWQNDTFSVYVAVLSTPSRFHTRFTCTLSKLEANGGITLVGKKVYYAYSTFVYDRPNLLEAGHYQLHVDAYDPLDRGIVYYVEEFMEFNVTREPHVPVSLQYNMAIHSDVDFTIQSFLKPTVIPDASDNTIAYSWSLRPLNETCAHGSGYWSDDMLAFAAFDSVRTSEPLLVIPKFSLWPGCEYSATVNATYVNTSNTLAVLPGIANTTISVLPTVLNATIREGLEFEHFVGNELRVHLDVIDPDGSPEGSIVPRVATDMWINKQTTIGGNSTVVVLEFPQFPFSVQNETAPQCDGEFCFSSQGAVLIVPPNTLEAGQTYRVNVTVKKVLKGFDPLYATVEQLESVLYNQRVSYNVMITTTGTPIPIVKIEREFSMQYSKGFTLGNLGMFDKDKLLTLRGSAVVNGNPPVAAQFYEWSVRCRNQNVLEADGSVTQGSMAIVEDCIPAINLEASLLESSLTTLNTKDITLQPSVLANSKRYTFYLRASVDGINWASANLDIFTDQAPYAGTIDVTEVEHRRITTAHYSSLYEELYQPEFRTEGESYLFGNVEQNINSTETEVVITAPSYLAWMNDYRLLSARQIMYKFGYQVVDQFGGEASQDYVLNDWNEIPLLKTKFIPPGYLRFIVWVRNGFGAVRKVVMGCHLNQVGGVIQGTTRIGGTWSTDDCIEKWQQQVKLPAANAGLWNNTVVNSTSYASRMAQMISSYMVVNTTNLPVARAMALLSAAVQLISHEGELTCPSQICANETAATQDLILSWVVQLASSAQLKDGTQAIQILAGLLFDPSTYLTNARTETVVSQLLASVDLTILKSYDTLPYNQGLVHSAMRVLVSLMQARLADQTVDVPTIREHFRRLSTVAKMGYTYMAPNADVIPLGVGDGFQANNGNTLLEMTLFKMLEPSLHLYEMRTDHVALKFPDKEIFADAQAVESGQPYSSIPFSKNYTHIRADADSYIPDIFVGEATFYNDAFNPYSYDDKLESFETLSGHAAVGFSSLKGTKLNMTLLPGYNNSIKVGLKTLRTTNSPKCFFRDDYGRTETIMPEAWLLSIRDPLTSDTYKAAYPFTREPVAILNVRADNEYGSTDSHPNWEPYSTDFQDKEGGVKEEVVLSPPDTMFFCEQTYFGDNPAPSVLAQGCFNGLHNYTLRATCTGHGVCNQDSSCACFCGFSGNNCSILAQGPDWITPRKNRIVTGAPGRMNMTRGFTSLESGLAAELVIMQYEPNLDICLEGGQQCGQCSDAGAAKLTFGYTPSGRGRLRLPISWYGSRDGGYGLVRLPKWDSGSALPAQDYTVCYCSGDTGCHSDCDFFDREQPIKIVATPILGPIKDPGDIRAVSLVPSTHRIRSGRTLQAGGRVVQDGDLIYVAPDCSVVPTRNTTTTSLPRLLHGQTEDLPVSEVAQYKTAAQSRSAITTTGPLTVSYYEELAASRAVDGSTEQASYAASCSQTAVMNYPWWTLDLEAAYEITTIRIWSRGDSPKYRLEGFEVWVGSDTRCTDSGEFEAAYCGSKCGDSHTIEPGYDLEIDCNRTQGSHVYVYLPFIKTQLELCEVEVYQVIETPYYSSRFTLPDTLSTSTDTAFKVCFSTLEMRSYGGMPEQDEYRPLDHSLIVIPKPFFLAARFGSHIRMLRKTAPDFVLQGGKFGDYVYLAPNCSEPWLTGVTDPAAIPYHRPTASGLLRLTSESKLTMPTTPMLVDQSADFGVPTSRELFICFATFGSEADVWQDFVSLDFILKVIPEPTGLLDPYQVRGNVQDVQFSQPVGWGGDVTAPPPPFSSPIAGQEGDIVVLQRDNCSRANTYESVLPLGPSGRAVLEGGGVASMEAVALGQWNQLELYDNYRICFATAESGGDRLDDFKDLGQSLTEDGKADISLLIEIDEMAPMFQVDTTVNHGEDLTIRWFANKDHTGRVSHPLDWIGIYRKGECSEEEPFSQEAESEEEVLETKHNFVNKCHLAMLDLPDHQESGLATFYVNDYLSAGEFEIRYFLGDSRNGQGYECRGLRGATTGEYLHCVLRAAAVSDTITVTMPSAVGHSNQHNALSGIPGLESYCDGPSCSYL